jgi:hypothetical protein
MLGEKTQFARAEETYQTNTKASQNYRQHIAVHGKLTVKSFSDGKLLRIFVEKLFNPLQQ